MGNIKSMFIYNAIKYLFTTSSNLDNLNYKKFEKIYKIIYSSNNNEVSTCKTLEQLLMRPKLNNLKKTQLVEIAKTLNKPTTGKKTDIIDKILKNEKSERLLGHIYIVCNPNSKTLKIGRTKKRDDEKQVSQYLYNRYRTAYGPHVAFILYNSKNMFNDERDIHKILHSNRVLKSELFNCTLKKAQTTCENVTGETGIKYTKNPK